MMAKKVAHFTNIAPHYRETLWLKILNDYEFQFHFYFGESSAKGIKSIDFDQKKWKDVKNQLHSLKNMSLFGRLVFQFGIINQVMFKNWDAVIILGNMNVISSWLAALILNFKRTPVLTWSHGMYGDEKGLKKIARIHFLKLADINLVYGHWAKKQMIQAGLDKNKINVIYNSLDYQKSKELRKKVLQENYYQEKGIFKKKAPVLIFVGRLTPQKNIDWLIKSVKQLTDNGIMVNAIIVGDGTERESLQKEADGMDNTHFFGACYDEEVLAKLIANADLCVSPGNVGLTAIHSLSYGTPVCTHNNFTKQMPEFEAIKEGETGCFFNLEEGNIAETIEYWLCKGYDRKRIRKACYEVIDSCYNPSNQAKILKESIYTLLP